VSQTNIVIDRLFLAVSFLVMFSLALRPVAVFRILALGRIHKVNARLLRVVKVIAAITAPVVAIYFILTFL
jgi:hypothetical protein